MARRGSSITLARPAVLDESVEKNVGSGESCAAEVQLFDENGERRDRFSTKPADKGQKTSTAEGVARASGIAFAEKGDTYFFWTVLQKRFRRFALENKDISKNPIEY